jgi:hypothetical protein
MILLARPYLRQVTTHRLLEEVCRDDSNDRFALTAWELRDALDLAPQGREPLPHRFESIEQVNRTSELLKLRVKETALPATLPEPPFAGIPGLIVPIRTVAGLIQESREMDHCVAGYDAAVAAGAGYVYRVMADSTRGVDRATLLVEPHHSGQCWVPRQLRGYSNSPVSEATREVVRAWVKQHCRASLS